MKKLLALILALTMVVSMAACAQKTDPAPATDNQTSETTDDTQQNDDGPSEDTTAESYKIFLITMDQMDQYWTNIDAGCQKAAEELAETFQIFIIYLNAFLCRRNSEE